MSTTMMKPLVAEMNLIEYAAEHRYRVRNLHDGRPLHPLRVPVGGRGKSDGYTGEQDRMDAIIGRFGYVCVDGDQLGWYLHRTNGKAATLRELTAAGAAVRQDGDGEAAGDAPVSAIDPLISAIRPYRVSERADCHGIRPGCRRATGPRTDANGREIA